MTAAELAARFRLDRRARSWRGDCPACGYPRAFAMREGRGGRVLSYCANGCDRSALDEAIAASGGGAWTAPQSDPAAAAAARQRRQDAALRLWSGSEPASGTLADTYLTARGLPGLAASPALRFRGDCQHPEGGRLPALVALVTGAAGEPIAIHRTFLRRDGATKGDIEPARASLGPVWGCAIRLADATPDSAVVIGEGIESAASAGRMIGLPAWAALSAGNLARGLVLPAGVRDVLIAADNDPPGEQAARAAALRWQAEGRRVRIARPNGGGDFNDLLMASARGSK